MIRYYCRYKKNKFEGCGLTVDHFFHSNLSAVEARNLEAKVDLIYRYHQEILFLLKNLSAIFNLAHFVWI